MSQPDPYGSTRLPADVDRPDTLMFGLTGRQLAVLAIAGMGLWGLWMLASRHLPMWLLGGITLPAGAAALALVVGRRDGLTLDQWLLAAARHRLRRRHLTPAGSTPSEAAPGWVNVAQHSDSAGVRPAAAGLLRMPVRDVADAGVIDLGRDGYAIITAASTVNFQLRTAAEQDGLVAGFAGWLNALDAPAQIVVRTHRLDLAGVADRIEATAPALAHPALEAAARGHATFVRELAQRHELLHRGVLVAVRQPGTGPAAAARVTHTAARTASALAGCEVTAQVLDGARAARVIAEAADPYRPYQDGTDNSAGYASADAIITAATGPAACASPPAAYRR
ncbi:PrgI family protein [Fodinicola acaciae]|uniref:PrgI family protein n=1 Tax=Fodinicola acaciae TaxID=2681555 RepID=UPI0013D6766F|nr:PrgI family protein [Fodinicola acaciae]